MTAGAIILISWGALAAVAGLELVETIREPDEYKGKVGGVGWMDAVMIARKKPFDDANPRDDFYQNLKEVVQPFVNRRYAFDPVAVNKGPSFKIYARAALTEPQEDKGQPRADKVSLRRKRLAAAKRRERAEGGNAKERPRQRQDGPRRPRVAMPGQAVPTGPRPDRQAADRERPARKGPARNRRNVKNNRPIKD